VTSAGRRGRRGSDERRMEGGECCYRGSSDPISLSASEEDSEAEEETEETTGSLTSLSAREGYHQRTWSSEWEGTVGVFVEVHESEDRLSRREDDRTQFGFPFTEPFSSSSLFSQDSRFHPRQGEQSLRRFRR
jgi:hypothetical protein